MIDQGTKDFPKDYIYKAQNIDRKYCGTSPTQQGPLEQCLRGFGNLLCLVVGQYGEVSKDFHLLLSKLAPTKVANTAQLEGRHVSEARCGLLLISSHMSE